MDHRLRIVKGIISQYSASFSPLQSPERLTYPHFFVGREKIGGPSEVLLWYKVRYVYV